MRCEISGENAELEGEFNWNRRTRQRHFNRENFTELEKRKFDWTLKSAAKQNVTSVNQFGQNFTILQEKIQWIRCEMTGENAEFEDEFDWRLKSNWKWEKKMNIWKRKNLTRENSLKWEEEMQNFNMNSKNKTTTFQQTKFDKRKFSESDQK